MFGRKTTTDQFDADAQSHSVARGGLARLFDASFFRTPKGDRPVRYLSGLVDNISQVIQTTFMAVLLLGAAAAVIFAAVEYGRGQSGGGVSAMLQRGDKPRAQPNDPSRLILDERALYQWINETHIGHAAERKVRSLSTFFSASEQVMLGAFEQYALGREEEAGLHFLLAAASGQPNARKLFKDLKLADEQQDLITDRLETLHRMNGASGHFLLGLYYLGEDVFRIAPSLATPLPFKSPNDFVREPDVFEAFVNFQISYLCGSTEAFEWRAEVVRRYGVSQETLKNLRDRARKRMNDGIGRRQRDRDAFCAGERLNKSIAKFSDQLKAFMDNAPDATSIAEGQYVKDTCAARFAEDLPAWLCDRRQNVGDASGAEQYRRWAMPLFSVLMDEVASGRSRGSSRGGASSLDDDDEDLSLRGSSSRGNASQYARNAPAAQSYARIKPAGGEDETCEIDPNTGECEERVDALACNDRAAYYFNQGEAEMAIGKVARARRRFEQAAATGRACGSPSGVAAAKRLAVLNLSCEYSVRSLARISRGYRNNADGGAIIDLAARQRALKALGHYDSDIDGRYGPKTREAARRFQREFGFDETGDITPIETVYLICGAAQNANNVKSMNMLGVMYVAGLGVKQNTDTGLFWLKRAADRGSTDAMFNLAIIYGSGTVLGSFHLCDLVENIQVADSYLQEASDADHPRARALARKYGALTPAARWEKLKEELGANALYVKRLEPIGESCRPNPSTPTTGPGPSTDPTPATGVGPAGDAPPAR